MAIAIVHHASKLSTGPGNLVSDSFDSTGANLLVVGGIYNAYTGGGGGASPTITDSKGNTYTALIARTGFDAGCRLYYVEGSPTVGTSHTVTSAGADEDSQGVLAASGAATSAYTSQSGSNGASGTSVQPGSLTPPEDNCLLVLGVNFFSGTGGSVNSSFTGLFTNGTANAKSTGWAYKIQTTAGAENPTTSWSGGAVAAAAMAVFKAAAVVGGSVYTGFRSSYLKKRKRVYCR